MSTVLPPSSKRALEAPSSLRYGIYYPEFYFLDEYLHLPKQCLELSVSSEVSQHIEKMKWLLMCNDFVHVPMDNFVFVATEQLRETRSLFLQDTAVGWMMRHGLLGTNEHGALDPRASLKLYRSRRIETGWSLSRVPHDLETSLIERLPTVKSNPDVQVITFETALAGLMGRAELELRDNFAKLERIVEGAQRAYGEDDISVEYIGEQLIKSALPDEQKARLLLSTRNIFYRSFAPADGLIWYSNVINPFELVEAAHQLPRAQYISYLYAPNFIERWFRMFLPPEEIDLLMRAFPAIHMQFSTSSLAGYLQEFRQFYHTSLIPEIDAAFPLRIIEK